MTQDQKYNPGDVVNGHILTAAGDWVPLQARPNEARQSGGSPEPRKRGRKALIGVGFVGVAVAAIAIGTSGAEPENRDGTTGQEINSSDDSADTSVDLSSFQSVDAATWEQIAKDPDGAKGQKIVVFAQVTQFDAATGADSFLANVGESQPAGVFELETNSVLSGEAGALAEVVQGDVLRVQSLVSGSLSYENTEGGATTVPALDVVGFEKVGYLDITSDAVLGAPVWNEFGGVAVPVAVTNSAQVATSYTISLVAESPDGSVQLGSTTAFVEGLAPGQLANAEASFFEDLPRDAVIKIASVERTDF